MTYKQTLHLLNTQNNYAGRYTVSINVDGPFGALDVSTTGV